MEELPRQGSGVDRFGEPRVLLCAEEHSESAENIKGKEGNINKLTLEENQSSLFRLRRLQASRKGYPRELRERQQRRLGRGELLVQPCVQASA